MTQPLSWSLHGDDRLSGVLEKLDRVLDRLARKLDTVTGDAKQMGHALGESEQGANRASRGLGGVTEHADAADSKMRNLLATMGRMATAAGVALGAAGAAASVFGVKAAAANETAQVSFEVMLGSAQRARDFLAQLQNFAKSTPFEMPGLRDAASKLLAVGVQTRDIIPLLTRIGDATAGVGTGAEGIDRAVYALGQMRRAGRVTLEDLMQLTDAGVPALDALATRMGISQAKLLELVSARKIRPDQVFAAILSGAGKQFGKLNGLMDKQSATLEGKWSNLTDSLSQTLGKAFEPALPAIKRVVDGAGNAVPAVIGKLQNMGRQVKDVFKGSSVPGEMMSALRELGKAILPELRKAWDRIMATVKDNREGLEKLGKFVADVVMPILGKIAVFGINEMANAFEGVIVVMGHIFPVLRFLTEAFISGLGGMLKAATIAFGWIPGLGPKLKKASTEFDTWAAGVRNTLDKIDGSKVNVTVVVHTKGELDYRAGERNPSGRAGGGPVWAGDSYDVGEMGRERFHPQQSGHIQSTSSVMGGQASASGATDEILLRVRLEYPDGRVAHEQLLAYKRNSGKKTLGLA